MRHSATIAGLLASVAFMCGAYAQTAQDSTTTSRTKRAARPASGSAIEEVVVTAEHRSAKVQDVPIAITALSNRQLTARGVTDAFDLNKITPSYNSNREVGFGTPFLRGIGTSNSTAGDEPAVATYVDGFYQGLSVAADLPFGDISRIEVLKGPQGTLYGRNAVGGLVNIITSMPSATPSVRGTVGYGNYNTGTGSLYATGALSDKVLADISVVGQEQGRGFSRNVVTGSRLGTDSYWAVKTKVLFKISDDVTFLLGASYADSFDDRANINEVEQGTVPLLHGPGITYATKPFDFAGNIKPFFNVKQAEINGTLKVDLGFANFVSLTQYRHVDSLNQVEGDGTTGDGVLAASQIQSGSPGGPASIIAPASLTYASREIAPYFATQEFQLVSTNGGPLKWIVGAFGQTSQDGYGPLSLNYIAAGQPLENIYRFQTTKAVAVFAQGTYAFDTGPLNGLSLTAGARYSVEEKAIGGTISIPAENNFTFGGDQSVTYRSPTWHAAAQYRLNPQYMVYASADRGFKSGIFDTTAVASPGAPNNPVKPEILLAYQAGIKADPMHGLRINIDGYYYDYKDLQTFVNLPSGLSFLQNAGAATMYGGEAEIETTPIDGLNLHGAIGIEHATYANFANASNFLPSANGGNYTTTVDANGKEVVRTPTVSGNVGGTYYYTFKDESELTLNASVAYTGRYYWDFSNVFANKAYALVDLSAKYSPPGGHWDITIWGKNITDHKYFVYLNNQERYTAVAYGDPATVGATFGFHF